MSVATDKTNGEQSSCSYWNLFINFDTLQTMKVNIQVYQDEKPCRLGFRRVVIVTPSVSSIQAEEAREHSWGALFLIIESSAMTPLQLQISSSTVSEINILDIT